MIWRSLSTHLVDGHQLLGGILLVLVQGRKLDLFRIPSHVPERALNGI